ncbi:MAG TPA: FHA domain-containing protein [Solirubrobacteraceae bacterium]|nr:FHA domain-containing protein [Solirubrobacteraceae bacterium]
MADLILEIVEGKDAGRQLDLDRPLDVGRDQGMPIALPDDTQVSRRHARVSPQNGVAVVEDLGSTNGTFVNDQPIHSPRQLSPGDRIRIGLTVMEVRSPQQVQQRASAVQPRPQFTQVGEGVLAPVPDQQLGGPAPASGGFVPAAGAAAPSAAAPQQEAPTENLPPQPTPPLPGARGAAPVFRPGVGFRAAETPAGYVPPEVVGDDEAESDYGALARLVDVRVKQQRNIAAFAILAASGLAVLLYFGLT